MFAPWLLMLLSNLPAILGVVQGVETAFSNSPTGAVKTGAQKLQAAVSLISTVAPAVAGEVASSPSNLDHTTKVVNGVVALLNSVNGWNQQQAAQQAASSGN